MTDEEKAKIFTIKLLNITEEKFDSIMLNYNNELLEENVIMYVYNSHLAGLNANIEHIAELEKENTELKEENKICEEIIIGEQQEINRLEKEKCELLGIIQGKDEVIAELKAKLELEEGRLKYWKKHYKYKSNDVIELQKENEQLKMKLLTLENKEQVVTTTVSN